MSSSKVSRCQAAIARDGLLWRMCGNEGRGQVIDDCSVDLVRGWALGTAGGRADRKRRMQLHILGPLSRKHECVIAIRRIIKLKVAINQGTSDEIFTSWQLQRHGDLNTVSLFGWLAGVRTARPAGMRVGTCSAQSLRCKSKSLFHVTTEVSYF
jgi:hypothetical protein